MAMTMNGEVQLAASRQAVWDKLNDPEVLKASIPGCEELEVTEDQGFRATVKVKVGPVSAKYKGTLRFEKLDPQARTAEIAAKGQESSGRGGADMRMQSRLAEKAPGETDVTVVSEVNVTSISRGRAWVRNCLRSEETPP